MARTRPASKGSSGSIGPSELGKHARLRLVARSLVFARRFQSQLRMKPIALCRPANLMRGSSDRTCPRPEARPLTSDDDQLPLDAACPEPVTAIKIRA
jgi:hypothetical protein